MLLTYSQDHHLELKTRDKKLVLNFKGSKLSILIRKWGSKNKIYLDGLKRETTALQFAAM